MQIAFDEAYKESFLLSGAHASLLSRLTTEIMMAKNQETVRKSSKIRFDFAQLKDLLDNMDESCRVKEEAEKLVVEHGQCLGEMDKNKAEYATYFRCL